MTTDDHQTGAAPPEETAVPPTPEELGTEPLDLEAAIASSRRRGGAGVIVLALLALVATGVALFQWQRAADLAAEQAERERVAAAAAGMGEALLSYDHTRLDAAAEAVTLRATEDFAQRYATAFADGLRAAIEDLEATAETEVVEVLVGDVEDRARAIVVIDSVVTSPEGTRDLRGAMLQMDLVLDAGRWLVDEVRSVSAVAEDFTPAEG